MTAEPQRNTPLTADDWQPGDWLVLESPAGPSNSKGDLFRFVDRNDPNPGRVRVLDKGDVPVAWHASRLRFLGRPDQSGWIPHDGGPNPAPGLRVDVRSDRDESSESGFPSERYFWSDQVAPITHWRPHVPAPAGERASIEEINAHASESQDPITSMLRDADERLHRDPPDILGAKVGLTGARMAVSIKALEAPPQPKGEVEAAVSGCEDLSRWLADGATYLGSSVAVEHSKHLRTLLSALTASQAREARAVEALRDLTSWFEDGPSGYGPWIIPAGKQGADDAVEAARRALSEFIDNGEDGG